MSLRSVGELLQNRERTGVPGAAAALNLQSTISLAEATVGHG